MEDSQHGRQPRSKENGIQSQWKMTLMDDEHDGRQPALKKTLIGLASQLCTEIGTAQPQLVFAFNVEHIVIIIDLSIICQRFVLDRASIPNLYVRLHVTVFF